jgi:hypothetical protein
MLGNKPKVRWPIQPDKNTSPVYQAVVLHCPPIYIDPSLNPLVHNATASHKPGCQTPVLQTQQFKTTHQRKTFLGWGCPTCNCKHSCTCCPQCLSEPSCRSCCHSEGPYLATMMLTALPCLIQDAEAPICVCVPACIHPEHLGMQQSKPRIAPTLRTMYLQLDKFDMVLSASPDAVV